MRIALVIILAFASCRSSASPERSAAAAIAPEKAEKAPLTLVTSGGASHVVHVELALTDDQREVGLMYRRSMADDDGMLFVFDDESIQSFWMKNTLIRLDMLFIRGDGSIAGIVENATPRSLSPRTVGKPSRYVLELNGGWCAAHGLKTGDKVGLGAALDLAERIRANK